MKYTYYPGCSLHGACEPYDRSLRKVMSRLGHELEELRDWNCCGATMYMSIKETVALAISARNLALAEKQNGNLIAPCSACYTTLRKTNRYLEQVPELKSQVDRALAEANLTYGLSVTVKHPLDVIVNEIGVEAIAARAQRSLDGLKIAPYYGCQIVRPEPDFDDREWPASLDDLFAALGAECVYFPVRVRCCGGMLMTTYPEVGKELTQEIVDCALANEADVIVTTCPLCQMNLEAIQKPGASSVPVLFFTQLLGIALGESAEDMDLPKSLLPLGEALESIVGGRP